MSQINFIIEQFKETSIVDDLPESSGVFIVKTCSLINEDPSEWFCTTLDAGITENIKRKIKSLPFKYDDLRFQYLTTEHAQEMHGQMLKSS